MKRAAVGMAVAAGALVTGNAAWATNGMLPHCTGIINCGMGGAGIAMATDATNLAINPALVGKLKDNELSVSMGWFHPDRSMYPAGGQMANKTTGPQDSQVTDYPDGSLAGNYRINPEWAVGVALFSAGGGETKYDKSRTGNLGNGNNNNFDREVRIRMGNMAIGGAYTPNQDFSLGGSVILAYQDFKSDMMTGSQAVTSGKDALDTSFGWGVRIGATYDFDPKVSIGITGSTPIYYQRLDKYRDLFIGSIDQPGQMGIGTALHPTSDLDVLFDMKYVMWHTVRAIGREPSDGGFGWKNQTIFSLGAQYRIDPTWTVRAGWNYGRSPIDEQHVFANLLFPAVVEHHVTAGASYAINERWEISGAGYYAPRVGMTDNGSGDSYSAAGRNSSVEMSQYGAQMGLRWKF
ncbi:MAG: OmpP1/FadL family transporter [Actinomycetota bacterium]